MPEQEILMAHKPTSTTAVNKLRLVLVNKEEYDFEGKISATFNGKNKSTLTLNGIYKLNGNNREILELPVYSAARLYYGTTLLFQGVIKESVAREISNRYQTKPVKVQIYSPAEFLSNGILLSRTFKKATPTDVINWVLDQFESTTQDMWKFELDNQLSFGIDNKIINWSIQDMSPYDIFNELANRTNSRFWTRNNKIFFRSWAKMVELAVDKLSFQRTPEELVILKDGQVLDELIAIDYNDSSSFGYVNSVVVRSKEVISNSSTIQTFNLFGGETKFTADFEIGDVKEAWVFNPSQIKFRRLVVTEDKYTTDPYNQFYELKWERGSKELTYNENTIKLQPNETLYVEYYLISQGVSIQQNNDEIKRVQMQSEFGDGHISYVENKDDIHDQEDLDNYAITLLDKMSTPRHDYYVKTGKDMGWQVSDIVTIDTNNYVVETIDWNHLFTADGVEVLEYTYNLTNTKNDTQTINFYDKRFDTELTDTNVVEKYADADLFLEFNSVIPVQHDDNYPTVPANNFKNLTLSCADYDLMTLDISDIKDAEGIVVGLRIYGK